MKKFDEIKRKERIRTTTAGWNPGNTRLRRKTVKQKSFSRIRHIRKLRQNMNNIRKTSRRHEVPLSIKVVTITRSNISQTEANFAFNKNRTTRLVEPSLPFFKDCWKLLTKPLGSTWIMEQISEDYCESMIAPIYKIGDRSACENQR